MISNPNQEMKYNNNNNIVFSYMSILFHSDRLLDKEIFIPHVSASRYCNTNYIKSYRNDCNTNEIRPQCYSG